MAPHPPPDPINERYRSLFHSAWYRAHYPEVNGPALDAFSHYLSIGRAAGYAPNPFFDPAWYARRYPEVGFGEIDPFWHYVVRGERLGYRPNPLFHPDWYAAQQGLSKGESPLAHFANHPAAQTLSPNPLFDSRFYLERNRPALAEGENPLSHYLDKGYSFCHPHPLFDSAWYLDRYPDVANSGANPLAHFLDGGGASGYQPNPYFDTEWYREQYLQEDEPTQNPLLHFIEAGAQEGCRPHPLFDPVWYRDRYPSVDRAGANPLAHFIDNRGSPVGAESEWEPNAFFDSTWIRAQHIELLPSTQTLRYAIREQPPEPFRPNPYFEQYAHFFASYRNGLRSHKREDNPLHEFFSSGLAETVIDTQEVGFEATRNPTVTIVIPAFNQFSHTLACLRSIGAARTRCSFEVLLADDASNRVDFATELESVKGLRVIRSDQNQGFIRTCNTAAEAARGRFLVFLNNDTVVLDDWLDQLLATPLRFSDTGVVGSKLLFPNGRVAEAGCVVWSDATAWNYGRRRTERDVEVDYAREVDYVSGASLLIERSFFHLLKGFDETYRPAYYEDTDLAFRTRAAGRRVLYQPASRVIHFEGASSSSANENAMKKSQATNRTVFEKAWRKEISGRPAEGEKVDLEKDRYAPRNAFFFDVCMPLHTRDARSIRLVEMMKIVRDEGYRVTFLPEALYAPEPFRTELGAEGIRVVTAHTVASPEQYLEREGASIDLVVVGRLPLAERRLGPIRRHCTKARVLFDAMDLIDLETLERAYADPQRNGGNALASVLGRVDASFVAPTEADQRNGSSPTESKYPIYRVGSIFDRPSLSSRPADRTSILFMSGSDPAVSADALVWLADELIPAVSSHLPNVHFFVPEGPVAESLFKHEPRITVMTEAELLKAGRIEHFALALLPTRSGTRLEGLIQMLLAKGLPCVATEKAAGRLPDRFRDAIQLAHRTSEFERAIARLVEDQAFNERASMDALRGMEALCPNETTRQQIRIAIESPDCDGSDAGLAQS